MKAQVLSLLCEISIPLLLQPPEERCPHGPFHHHPEVGSQSQLQPPLGTQPEQPVRMLLLRSDVPPRSNTRVHRPRSDRTVSALLHRLSHPLRRRIRAHTAVPQRDGETLVPRVETGGASAAAGAPFSQNLRVFQCPVDARFSRFPG